jgi:2-oxo-4-hydroxy-4-carboxy-5-ureidoimidazoline decarboxylase
MTVDEFNAVPAQEAHDALALCCVSERWIAPVLAGRPYDSRDTLLTVADTVWAQMHSPEALPLMEEHLLQAYEGHPKIGDVSSLREKYAASGHLAAGEQVGASGADDAVLERLARANREYEERFGFIFIVCATGKSAAEMLELLEARLHNDRATELVNAAIEQGRILRLRLEKLL